MSNSLRDIRALVSKKLAGALLASFAFALQPLSILPLSTAFAASTEIINEDFSSCTTGTSNPTPAIANWSFSGTNCYNTSGVGGSTALKFSDDGDRATLTLPLGAGQTANTLSFHLNQVAAGDDSDSYFFLDQYNGAALIGDYDVSAQSDNVLPLDPTATKLVFTIGNVGGKNLALDNVVVTANSTNTAPIATDATFTGNENASLNGSLATNATDADGDALIFSKVTDPSNGGSVTLAMNGTFIYNPPFGFTGTDSFTFKVNDGTADSNIATATITVTDTTAPTLNITSPVANTSYTGTITEGASASDGGSGVAKVQILHRESGTTGAFQLDGTRTNSGNSEPFIFSRDETHLTNGTYDFCVVTVDNDGNGTAVPPTLTDCSGDGTVLVQNVTYHEALTPPAAAAQTSQTVRSTDLDFFGGWYYYDDNTDTPSITDSSNAQIVANPAATSGDNGAVLLNGSNGARNDLATLQYNDMQLSDIAALGFSSYQPSNNNGSSSNAPFVGFDVDFGTGMSGYQNRLVYVPEHNANPTPDQGQWQAYEGVASNGEWTWSGYDAYGHQWPDGNTDRYRSWNDIISSFPDAAIAGQFVVRAGDPYPYDFQTYVDHVYVATTGANVNYNFELTTTVPGGGSTGGDSSNGGSDTGKDNADSAGRGNLNGQFGLDDFAFATGSQNGSSNDDNGDVLGTSTPDKNTGTDQSTDQDNGGPWKILGLAWYWWLLILAVLAALWYAYVLWRRRREAEEA